MAEPVDLSQLPDSIREMLYLAPDCQVDPSGYLTLPGYAGLPRRNVPQARTQWNLERSRPIDCLDYPARWAIVLHWYGDRAGYDRTVAGYLRGFDELRYIAGNLTRTSSHFLVGEAPANLTSSSVQIGLLQTQIPGSQGIPYLASHLQPRLDYLAHQEKRQYFVRALYQLSTSYPRLRSILQDWFDGSSLDPNWRSLAVDLTGADFERPEFFPDSQQVANVLAVVWALMKRYQIPATNLLGHHEIQMEKPDPGKKFMAILRLLLGIKALSSGDGNMARLVFSAFEGSRGNLPAPEAYFRFQRQHLALVGVPSQIYDWEKTSGYWRIMETLFGPVANSGIDDRMISPLQGRLQKYGDKFLVPEVHAGIDLFPIDQGRNLPYAQLVAGGECLYTGVSKGSHPGRTAVFRHRRPDGSTLLTIYSHLDGLGQAQVGCFYPQKFQVGRLRQAGREAFLHFAVALGSAWEGGLQPAPDLPANVSPDWIRARFLDPLACIPELN